MEYRCLGIRGATTVETNTAEAILQATQELLQAMIAANDLQEADVASVMFSMTPDLDAVYPAQAARQLGWSHTALFCCQEIPVKGGLPHCIRVLVHWNTVSHPSQVRHIYLNRAQSLRPDLPAPEEPQKAANDCEARKCSS